MAICARCGRFVKNVFWWDKKPYGKTCWQKTAELSQPEPVEEEYDFEFQSKLNPTVSYAVMLEEARFSTAAYIYVFKDGERRLLLRHFFKPWESPDQKTLEETWEEDFLQREQWL
ncbi:hypothetical protein [Thermoactinomyces sp. CICC 23799]|uniref:hypothetical protein n=1 Tax=Thermoactinomyces sp. CICC 23799 TaxID=2767429 RepID=UPI0018DBB331|nr:hypothetical protein [Thermoactinomyces sp. CICC 23799]MBH8600535.1 hypothetical protein [Thermoactinomyces sp. CICC 23799]